MRKFLTGSLVVASLGGGIALSGTSAFATGIPDACGSNPAGASVDPGSQSGIVQVCLPSTPAGSNDTVTLSGSAATQGGYIIAEGNTAAVDGYIGVSSIDSGIVACGNGASYDTSGGNNVVVPTPSPSDPSGFPAAVQAALTRLQGIQTNPCTPAAP
jgi:hypothetical protein